MANSVDPDQMACSAASDLGLHCCKSLAVPILRAITVIFTSFWANSADDKLMIVFYFSQKTDFDISCKLFP